MSIPQARLLPDSHGRSWRCRFQVLIYLFGPLTMGRGMLEATGAWVDVRDELAEMHARREPAELVVLGRKG